jgi:hypothetical protein
MSASTHMIVAPSRQAVTSSARVHHDRYEFSWVRKSLTDTAGDAHDPAASVVAHCGSHTGGTTVVACYVKRSS